jgi:hypothetical protein
VHEKGENSRNAKLKEEPRQWDVKTPDDKHGQVINEHSSHGCRPQKVQIGAGRRLAQSNN